MDGNDGAVFLTEPHGRSELLQHDTARAKVIDTVQFRNHKLLTVDIPITRCVLLPRVMIITVSHDALMAGYVVISGV